MTFVCQKNGMVGHTVPVTHNAGQGDVHGIACEGESYFFFLLHCPFACLAAGVGGSVLLCTALTSNALRTDICTALLATNFMR
jgi:hypothetical protein